MPSILQDVGGEDDVLVAQALGGWPIGWGREIPVPSRAAHARIAGMSIPRRADSAGPVSGWVAGVPGSGPHIPDHELLRCIGRGSYGEVWLARNVLGEFRAVKAIYRRAFEHDRPYEREVEGIRNFEPVSRTHPSQLNVLHVGRNDEAGYFYYVMELADDAMETPESEIRDPKAQSAALDAPLPISEFRIRNSELYQPHTLKTDLDRRGRLPVEDCIRIGLALTTALENLHAHGLVHRDVKPSNIIFIHGVPKLADIGLVASMDATMSFVGTSGFLPPEGPGTPKADLYSLGKVLYEASTGRDRQEFPKLPANLDEWTDAAQLVELNGVILKACAHDPSRRYQSAHELAADLLLLQRGQSIKRLRTVERRLKVFRQAGLAAAALLVVAAALYWGARQQVRATARQLYVADMNRALQSWEGGNVTLARELLETHRRLQPEMLGFEWRLLAQLCQPSDVALTLRGHEQTVWAVAFSPDGKTLVTGSGDGTAKFWNVSSGELTGTLTGHAGTVGALAFSSDGELLATGSRDFTVKLWNVEQRTQVTSLTGHTNAVRTVAFAPDGQTLLSAGEDETIRWWNLATAQEIAASQTGFTVERLVFSPEGQTFAAVGADNQVHLWNVVNRQKEGELRLHEAIILDAAFSSDGHFLATASFDGRIKLWDRRANQISATLGRGAPVRCVAFAPGDQLLGAAADDGVVRLWSVERREVVATLRGHKANVRALTFSKQGALLATAGEDHTARLWNVSEAALGKDLLKHEGLVNGVGFSPDSRSLASTDPNEGTLRLWDCDTQQVNATQRTQRDAVWSVAFAPDGKAVATGGVDGSVRLWDGATLRELWSASGHQGGVDSVAISPDGRFVASGSRDQSVKVWQRDSGGEQATFATPGNIVRGVSFAPMGATLAFGGGDGRLRLWSFLSANEPTALEGHPGEIYVLAFSPDGQWLVSGGADRTIRVWDVAARKVVETLAGHTAMISSLAFAPDAKTLASGSWDSTVKLWNLRLFREVATLRAHSGQVTQVAFAPDGNMLASSSGDGTVRLWRAVPDTESAHRGETKSRR